MARRERRDSASRRLKSQAAASDAMSSIGSARALRREGGRGVLASGHRLRHLCEGSCGRFAMAVSARKQLQFWGIGFALLCLVLWLLGSTLLPFLLGAAMAYFLDPLADRLERLGMSRLAATSVIAVTAITEVAQIRLSPSRWSRSASGSRK